METGCKHTLWPRSVQCVLVQLNEKTEEKQKIIKWFKLFFISFPCNERMADITVTQVADARPHSSEALHLLQPIASRILRLINPGEHSPIYTHTASTTCQLRLNQVHSLNLCCEHLTYLSAYQ